MRHLNVLWILEVAQWLPGQISLPIPAKPLHQELMMRLLPNRYHAMLENFLHCEVATSRARLAFTMSSMPRGPS
jgi:hypothetical protein